MPELPDVEAQRRYLAEHAAGQRIAAVEVADEDVLRNTSPQGLGRAVSGSRFEEPGRHGKWLLAPTDGGTTVVMHFGMTGHLTWADGDDDRDDHDHVVFRCDDGELRFNLTRKFGGVWRARGESELREITGDLGPDALDVGLGDLRDLLDGKRGGLKSALMDQGLLAGIGNIVADETLWHAELHPGRGASDLAEDEVDRLHGALMTVLEESTEEGFVPRREEWLTHARDVEDPQCPRCGGDVERDEVNQRPTYLCPSCQPPP